MTCRVIGPAIVCGGPMQKVRDEIDGDPRWCFRCRRIREFHLVVWSPVERSYYGPVPGIECSTCGLQDGDLFPGRFREWEES